MSFQFEKCARRQAGALLVDVAQVVGVIILAAVAAFLIAVFYRNPKADGSESESIIPSKFPRVRSFLERAGSEIRNIGFTPAFYGAFGLSMLFLFLQALTFWLIMRGYGLALPFHAGAIVYFIVHFGTVLPNAPANVGVFQFFCVLGLALFHVQKAAAVSFSIVAFFLLSGPLWLVGFFALGRSGTTLGGAMKEIKRFRGKGS